MSSMHPTLVHIFRESAFIVSFYLTLFMGYWASSLLRRYISAWRDRTVRDNIVSGMVLIFPLVILTCLVAYFLTFLVALWPELDPDYSGFGGLPRGALNGWVWLAVIAMCMVAAAMLELKQRGFFRRWWLSKQEDLKNLGWGLFSILVFVSVVSLGIWLDKHDALLPVSIAVIAAYYLYASSVDMYIEGFANPLNQTYARMPEGIRRLFLALAVIWSGMLMGSLIVIDARDLPSDYLVSLTTSDWWFMTLVWWMPLVFLRISIALGIWVYDGFTIMKEKERGFEDRGSRFDKKMKRSSSK